MWCGVGISILVGANPASRWQPWGEGEKKREGEAVIGSGTRGSLMSIQVAAAGKVARRQGCPKKKTILGDKSHAHSVTKVASG